MDHRSRTDRTRLSMKLWKQYMEGLVQGKKMTVRLLYFDKDSLALKPKLLLLKRSDHCQRAGQLEPPGGILEPNESPKDGMIREISEETGLYLSKSDIYPFFYFDFISDSTPVQV